MTMIQGGNSIDEFKENLKDNMEELYAYRESINSDSDRQFAIQLCEFYDNKGYLTFAQMRYAVKYWNEINSQR